MVWRNHQIDVQAGVSHNYYEGGLKTYRPSLPETRDKRPLGKESDRSWCHRHTTSMIKLFLVAAHASVGIGGSIWARWKVLGQAYNRLETRDKRPFGRDPDRGWYPATLVKSFLGRNPLIYGLSGITLVSCRRFPWSHGLRSKKRYTSVEVTPAPVRFPAQRSVVLSFMSVVD